MLKPVFDCKGFGKQVSTAGWSDALQCRRTLRPARLWRASVPSGMGTGLCARNKR